MTAEETQQGWRLAAIGTLGLVVVLGGLGTMVALAPAPRQTWVPDARQRAGFGPRADQGPAEKAVPLSEGKAAGAAGADRDIPVEPARPPGLVSPTPRSIE